MHSCPPLTALRAFEAAGRHLSFRKAAEELHVTPAAVSHQIKLLEDQLGVPLFRRGARRIELTDAGRTLLPRLHDAFDLLLEAVRSVRTRLPTTRLAVSAPPSFADKWLMPRLHRFVAAHPEIDLRLSASVRQVDTCRQGATEDKGRRRRREGDPDIGIRFGGGGYAPCQEHLLFKVSFTPLCSPRLLDSPRPLREPGDLRHHLLLHDDVHDLSEVWPTWAQWLAVAGIDGVAPEHGPHFSHPAMGLDAAIDGTGVVLGARELAAADLAAGRLVAPFDLSIDTGAAYYVVYPPANAGEPRVAAFRDWLLAEAGAPAGGA